MREALAALTRSCGLPIAFGGLTGDGAPAAARAPGGEGAGFRISQLVGTTTCALRGLAISSGSGLGGKAIALARPVAVTDYRASRAISHEYDAAVAAEGLRSVLAVPVVVRRRVRAVLYAALREPTALGDRALAAAVRTAGGLERSIAARDDADRLRAAAPAAWEEVRAAHAQLRTLAHDVPDARLRGELLAACARLESACGGTARGDRDVALSPREVDVLSCVSRGATNAAVADRLGLRPETVKAYLRSAMRKLGAHTRLEAVVAARRAGLLP
ncbi:helix-turn-helix transcriptional regulator [Streptomyces sp. ICBB 8177]|uniref:helix-turn-helix transcriptional regulator n=1 Tax=Streptomyces sp. ICBB 8177 TaxID=563922 RepID=UPI001F5446ED|nr:helix-turn-helix transcriptional regulator [Streptomyces sp. ICBB 8177]